MSSRRFSRCSASIRSGGHRRPAETQRRADGLRGRAEVDDPIGREALERADRHAVVAELGVVVVLDDQGVAAARPGDELAAPARVERRAGRIRVRGRDQHGADVVSVERGGVEPALVDRDGHRCEPGHRDRIAVRREARILDRHAANAAAVKRAPPCQHFVEHAAERPDIGALVHRPGHAPARDSCTRVCPEFVRRRNVDDLMTRGQPPRDPARHRFRQAEIEDLAPSPSAALRADDVGRLQVAMDDPFLVRGVQRVGDLARDAEGFGRAAVLGQSIRQRRPSTSSSTNPCTPSASSIPKIAAMCG